MFRYILKKGNKYFVYNHVIGKNDSAGYDDNATTFLSIDEDDEKSIILKIIEAKKTS